MSDHSANKYPLSQSNQKDSSFRPPISPHDPCSQPTRRSIRSVVGSGINLITSFYSICLQFIDDFQKIPCEYEEAFILTDEDIFGGGPSNPLFLGDYSYEEIDNSLQEYQVKKGLSERGYDDITINIDTTDHWIHKLNISDKSLLPREKRVDYCDHVNSEDENVLPTLPQNDQFLINLIIRKKEFVFSDFRTYQLMRRIETYYNKDDINDEGSGTSYGDNQIRRTHYIDGKGATQIYKFLEKELTKTYLLSLIEWICMQDPRRNFSRDQPQFPGQNYPGLRVGRRVGNMLIELETSKGRDGLGNIPEYFHNAFMYHMQKFRFLNPAFQAYFDCLCDSLSEDIKTHGLSAVSWAFHNGHVKNANGDVEVWNPEDQIYPTSTKLRLYFSSKGYKRLYETFYDSGYHVSIDWINAKEIWKYSLKDEISHFGDHREVSNGEGCK